jgi:ABC-type transport system involved in cytochrome bd biosynthesis fused ATPase/permease subunit
MARTDRYYDIHEKIFLPTRMVAVLSIAIFAFIAALDHADLIAVIVFLCVPLSICFIILCSDLLMFFCYPSSNSEKENIVL